MGDFEQGTSPKKNEKYTYEDYLTWSDDERWELINGKAYATYGMSPAPKVKHQRLSFLLALEIGKFLEDKLCEAFSAPFDVKFDNTTVVQPDLLVICDKTELDEYGCNGAPDLVVEILSDSTAFKDETEKRLLYERTGVKEYWIVNPDLPEIMQFIRSGEKFNKPEHLSRGETLISKVLAGFELQLDKIV